MDGVQVFAIGFKGGTRDELPVQFLFTRTLKKKTQTPTLQFSGLSAYFR
jgi:hypothetical protein